MITGVEKADVDFSLPIRPDAGPSAWNTMRESTIKAIENKEKAISAGRVAFKAENAEYFSVPREVDRIYFFNPFSLEICKK